MVTGGGGGIGRAICEAFASLGAQVAVVERDPKRAAEIRDRLASLGSHAPVMVGDVTNDVDVDRFFDQVRESHGRLDVLVNNVGATLARRSSLEQTTATDWDDLYRTNLRQVFAVTRQAIPLLRASGPGGSVISISTIEAFRGIPNFAAYGALKTAITGFTRALALELGPDGIRVNAIAPETTETDLVKVHEWIGPHNHDQIQKWIPLGRFGRPRDIAGCAVFLASDLSSWVTGTTLNVDGGVLAAAGWIQYGHRQWTNTPVVTGAGFEPWLWSEESTPER